MSQKLLKLLPDGAGNEQTVVSIRSLKDTETIVISLPQTTVQWDSDYKKLLLHTDSEITFAGGLRDGHQLVLAVTQDNIAPHTLTFTNVRLGTDIWSFPLLSTALGKTDRFMFFYDASSNTYDLIGYTRGF